MIEGFLKLGQTYLQGDRSFLEVLVNEEPEKTPKGEPRYIVELDLDIQLDRPRLRAEPQEVDPMKLVQALWIGNAPSNNPQDRLTTNNIAYLASQALPNLRGNLPDDSSLRKLLDKLIKSVYFDLGEKREVLGESAGDAQYERYRYMWDLARLGVAGLELTSKRDREEIEALCEESGVAFPSPEFLRVYALKRGKAKAAADLIGRLLTSWVCQELKVKRDQIAGFVDILELGGTTAYTEAVIPNEQPLPAAEVYPDLYALGN